MYVYIYIYVYDMLIYIHIHFYIPADHQSAGLKFMHSKVNCVAKHYDDDGICRSCSDAWLAECSERAGGGTNGFVSGTNYGNYGTNICYGNIYGNYGKTHIFVMGTSMETMEKLIFLLWEHLWKLWKNSYFCYGNIYGNYGKTHIFVMGTSMVSCRRSLKPIHWW